VDVAVFGDFEGVAGESGATDCAQVEGDDFVGDGAELFGDGGGGEEFVAVALAVVDGEGVDSKAVTLGAGEGDGGVEAAGKEEDGWGNRH
jgi:hypothetical protein